MERGFADIFAERGIMRVQHSKLEEAFLDDHRHLTRGLTDVLDALKAEEDARAIEAADRLDRTVGPHMEFEERVFYPELAKIMGREYVRPLYGEHGVGRRAISRMLEHLLEGQPETEPEADLSEAEESRLFDRLVELRERRVRWTDREASEAREASPQG